MPVKGIRKERIAVISDGTCDTAEAYVRAVLAQFERAEAQIVRVPRLREPDQILSALSQFQPPYLIVYTFAKEQLRKLVWSEIRKRNLVGFDILFPAVELFSEFLNVMPAEQQAVLHSMQAMHYFDRMEAIEYTVKHDDGMRLNDLNESDLILTGISRTSKTPTSMYLGHKGYKVANVPLVSGMEAPLQLIKAHEAKVPVIMLTIDPPALEKIRRSRFQKLGNSPQQNDNYVNREKIEDEISTANALARRFHWPVLNVTNKAIEETAAEILLLVAPKEENS